MSESQPKAETQKEVVPPVEFTIGIVDDENAKKQGEESVEKADNDMRSVEIGLNPPVGIDIAIDQAEDGGLKETLTEFSTDKNDDIEVKKTEELKEIMSNLFSLENEERAMQLSQAADEMPENRVRIMLDVLGETEKNDAKKSELLLQALKANADMLNKLSDEGFKKSLGLLSAEDARTRIDIIKSLPKEDQNKLQSQWSPQAAEVIGEFLVKVDKRAKNEKLLDKENPRKEEEITISETAALNEAIENPEASQDVLTKAIMLFIEQLLRAVQELYGKQEEKKEEEKEKEFEAKIIGDINKELTDVPVDQVEAKKSELLKKAQEDKEGAQTNIDKFTDTLKTAEENVSIAEKELTEGTERSEKQEALTNAKESRDKAIVALKEAEQLLKKCEIQIKYLNSLDVSANNPVLKELRKVADDFYNNLDENNKKKFGEFNFRMVMNKGKLVPAMVLKESQVDGAVLPKLLDGKKVIIIEEETRETFKKAIAELNKSKKS